MPKYALSCTIVPRYLPEQSTPAQRLYAFSYTITIANTGDIAAQVVARHWTVNDADGHTEEVRGLGVVGQQPLIPPGEVFEYTSGTRLRTPTGTMQGRYLCMAEDGTPFDCDIPAFVLDATADGEDGRSHTLH